MSEPAKRVWVIWEKILRDMGLFNPDFSVALERACELYGDIVELRASIAEHGRFYETIARSGEKLWKAHPAQAQLADSDRRLSSYLSELGLTPSGRARLLGSKMLPRGNEDAKAAGFFDD
jgi:P27 family predicted phage terminase small subunit